MKISVSNTYFEAYIIYDYDNRLILEYNCYLIVFNL